jgi:hypothetical protein
LPERVRAFGGVVDRGAVGFRQCGLRRARRRG